MKKLAGVALVVILWAGTAAAGDYDFDFPSDLANSTFENVVREAGLIAAYRGIAPAEPQGITGFDIGIETSVAEIDSSEWNRVVDNNDAPDYFIMPRIHVRKGLPFGLDVGASYAQILDSDIALIGGELQWALLDGTLATPALSLRGSFSTLQGVDDLDLLTYGVDAVISKGFAMFTPYAGIGVVRIEGEYAGDDSVLENTLEDQDFTELRYFAGLQMSMALLRLTVDLEYSEMPIVTAKLSLGF